jgi:hypothetical protein
MNWVQSQNPPMPINELVEPDLLRAVRTIEEETEIRKLKKPSVDRYVQRCLPVDLSQHDQDRLMNAGLNHGGVFDDGEDDAFFLNLLAVFSPEDAYGIVLDGTIKVAKRYERKRTKRTTYDGTEIYDKWIVVDEWLSADVDGKGYDREECERVVDRNKELKEEGTRQRRRLSEKIAAESNRRRLQSEMEATAAACERIQMTVIGENRNQITLSLSRMPPKSLFTNLNHERETFVVRALASFGDRIVSLAHVGDEWVQSRKTILDDSIRQDITEFFDENQAKFQIVNCSAVLSPIRDEVRVQMNKDIDEYFERLKTKLLAREVIWGSAIVGEHRVGFIGSAAKKFTQAVEAVTPIARFRMVLLKSQQFVAMTQELSGSAGTYFDKGQDRVRSIEVQVDKVFDGFAEKPFATPRRYRWRAEGSEMYPVSDRRAQYRYVYVQSQNYGHGRIFSNIPPIIDQFVANTGPSLPNSYQEVGWTYENRQKWSSI